MIYYLKLTYIIENGKARGSILLLSPDDLQEKKLQLDFETVIDTNLDLLTITIDPNVIVPSNFVSNAAETLQYNLMKEILDSVELNSILSLINDLT